MEAPVPSWSRRDEFVEAARAFYRRPPESRAQERFEFPPAWHDPTLRADLIDARGEVCAYCQSPPGPQAGEIRVGHYRPPGGVIGEDQQPFPDHYWWLAYEPDNLLLICDDCDSRRGNRFPVGAKRAEPDTPREEIDGIELPQLLDPGREDLDVELAYGPGEVSGTTERARWTVRVMQLNRAWLVQDRAAAYERELKEFDPEFDLADFLDDDEPYRGARLQARGESHDMSFPDQPPQATKSKATVRRAKTEQRAADAEYAVADVTQEQSFVSARTIERIRIHQFRIIDDLDLQLTGRPGEWRMLLGENGTGKSTILQAVALTLIDGAYRDQLGLEPRRFVRRGCRSGYVEITLSATQDPVRLTFELGDDESSKGRWGGTAEAANAHLLAYGSTRLLPRQDAARDDASELSRAANLFDPFVALGDADRWLINAWHHRRDHFNAAARALSDLLGQGLDTRLRVVEDPDGGELIELRENGVWKPLDQLSDGYQTVLALALDVMAVLVQRYPDMKDAEGVVLIDELGSHLHPSWQLRIVSELRLVFPKVQFVATTHNPLCLRGLDPGEIVLMRRRPGARGRVVAVTELPDLTHLRVDQMLTSPHFGLGTTLDMEVAARYRRAEELRLKAAPTASEREELRDLEREIRTHERLGETPRQAELYEAISEQLRRQVGHLDESGPSTTDAEALDPVVRILDAINEDRIMNARRGVSMQRDGDGVIS